MTITPLTSIRTCYKRPRHFRLWGNHVARQYWPLYSETTGGNTMASTRLSPKSCWPSVPLPCLLNTSMCIPQTWHKLECSKICVCLLYISSWLHWGTGTPAQLVHTTHTQILLWSRPRSSSVIIWESAIGQRFANTRTKAKLNSIVWKMQASKPSSKS